MSSHSENSRFTEFDKSLLKNSFFTEFFSRINCPFCLKAQSDKTILIKHLDEDCTAKMKERCKLFATFLIFPSNFIKCNVCSDIVLTTIDSYFSHLYNEDHILKCSEVIRAGKEFTDLLYCACCKMLVLNNYIQLQSHLEHEIHEVRRSSSKSDYFLSKKIYCVYCFHSGDKRFECLLCSNYLFNTSRKISHHFKSSNHKKNVQKNNFSSGIYCCFCDKRMNEFEVRPHFTSNDHLEKEKIIKAEGSFELCLYCGFVCETPQDLYAHMKRNCDEINKIRQQKGWKVNEDSKKETKKDLTNEDKIEKKRCVLVKGNNFQRIRKQK